MDDLKIVVESPVLLAMFLCCAAVPAGIALAVVREFSAPLKDRWTFWRRLGFAVFGAFLAEIIAVLVYGLAESKWCRDMFARGTYCDGQGPMILILIVPLCAILASCISSGWTWYSLRASVQSPRAPILSYRGSNRMLNIGFVVTVQALYWSTFTLAIYFLTLHLLEPPH